MTRTPPPTMTTLVLLTGLSVLSLNMFLPSLRQIAVGLEADYALVSLSIGGYLAVSAVLQLIMGGPLADLIGRRPVILVGGVVMFTLASAGCLLATNVWIFLGFRMLQGGIVSGMVLSRAVVRDLHEPTRPRGSWASWVWRWRWPPRSWGGRCWAALWTSSSAGAPTSWPMSSWAR